MPLLLVGLLVLVVGGVGGAYYFSEYRPRQYLEDWSWEMGYADTLVRTQGFANSDKAYVRLEQACAPGYGGCAVSPAEDIVNWLGRGVGNMTEQEAAECFRDGCERVFFREGHKAVVRFQQVTSAGWNFVVEVHFYW